MNRPNQSDQKLSISDFNLLIVRLPRETIGPASRPALISHFILSGGYSTRGAALSLTASEATLLACSLALWLCPPTVKRWDRDGRLEILAAAM
jgi:hypothetical protein